MSEFLDRIQDPSQPVNVYPNLPREHQLYGQSVHCVWPGIACRCQDYIKHRPTCHWRHYHEWERNPKCDCLGTKLNLTLIASPQTQTQVTTSTPEVKINLAAYGLNRCIHGVNDNLCSKCDKI